MSEKQTRIRLKWRTERIINGRKIRTTYFDGGKNVRDVTDE